MRKILYIITYLFLVINNSYSQNKLAHVDSVNIDRANIIRSSILGKFKTKNHLILIINEKFLLIIKQREKYKVYRGRYSFSIEHQKREIMHIDSQMVNRDRILDQCFNDNICTPSFVYVGDDPQRIESSSWGAAYYYFSIFSGDTKKYEISLPLTQAISSNKASPFPINQRIIKHLVKLMHLFP